MFNPTRLSLARRRNGLSMTALASLVGMSPRTISSYEGGAQPSNEALTALSEALGFSIQFFLGPDIPEPHTASVSFRSLTKMTASERDRAMSAGAMSLAFNDWLQNRYELPTADLPDMSGETDPEIAAQQLRREWSLGDRPIGNLTHLLESKGVRIFSLSVDSLNVDALSFWHGETSVIFLNSLKSAERSRFDAAHELGHLVLHRHARDNDSRSMEREANAFASALLMPRTSILAKVPKMVTLPRLISMKHHWRVSVAALNYRIHSVGITNDWQYRQLSSEIASRGFRKIEPNAISKETSALLSLVMSELRSSSISQADIAESMGIPHQEIAGLLHGLTLTSLAGGANQNIEKTTKSDHLKVVK